MKPDYASIGALAGATFAGLWVGTLVWLAVTGLGQGDEPASAFLFEILLLLVAGGIFGLCVAVIGTVPAAVVAACIVFPLMPFVKGRLAPTRVNAAMLGTLVGAVPVSLMMVVDLPPGIVEIVDAFAGGGHGDVWTVVVAAAVGGAFGGLVCRALITRRSVYLAVS